MFKQAGIVKTTFMFLILVAIIVAIVMLLNGKIELPVESEIEQTLTCSQTCESLGKGIITNATGQDDCEVMGGTYVEDLDSEQIQVWCCSK